MNEFVLSHADTPNKWVASYETLEEALADIHANQLARGITYILWDRIPGNYRAIYLVWESKVWKRTHVVKSSQRIKWRKPLVTSKGRGDFST